MEGEAKVENDGGSLVQVGAQRKTRERGQVQVESVAEEVRECRGGWDPVQAQRKPGELQLLW